MRVVIAMRVAKRRRRSGGDEEVDHTLGAAASLPPPPLHLQFSLCIPRVAFVGSAGTAAASSFRGGYKEASWMRREAGERGHGERERERVYQALGPGLGMSPSTGALASAESNTRIVHRRACTSSSSQTCMIPSPPLS